MPLVASEQFAGCACAKKFQIAGATSRPVPSAFVDFCTRTSRPSSITIISKKHARHPHLTFAAASILTVVKAESTNGTSVAGNEVALVTAGRKGFRVHGAVGAHSDAYRRAATSPVNR
jgi:hypothetical protein